MVSLLAIRSATTVSSTSRMRSRSSTNGGREIGVPSGLPDYRLMEARASNSRPVLEGGVLSYAHHSFDSSSSVTSVAVGQLVHALQVHRGTQGTRSGRSDRDRGHRRDT